MATLADCIKKCDDTLTKLGTLMNAALAAKNVADATALQSRLEDMTYKRGVLARAAIKADDATIAKLNGQLDAVTKAATDAMAGIAKVASFLDDFDAAMKTINGIAGVV